MTPAELLKMAGIESSPTIASALRSYAELVSQLAWLQERRSELAYVKLEPKAIESAAKFTGWPGLEER